MSTFTHDGNGGNPTSFPVGKWIGKIGGSKWELNGNSYDLIYIISVSFNNGNWTSFNVNQVKKVTKVNDRVYGTEIIKLSANNNTYPKSGENSEGVWKYYGLETK